MEVLIDYITNYNDDGNEHYNLIKNVLLTSACYEIIYENEENEIVYSYLDPLQTVAIWDYSTPRNLVGLVRYYYENDINGIEKEVVELIDKVGTRTFQKEYEKKNRIKIKANKDIDFVEVIRKGQDGKIILNNHNIVPYNLQYRIQHFYFVNVKTLFPLFLKLFTIYSCNLG